MQSLYFSKPEIIYEYSYWLAYIDLSNQCTLLIIAIKICYMKRFCGVDSVKHKTGSSFGVRN